MQFRLDWIGEYVELPGGVEETARVLTDIGLTTDGWEPCGDTWLLDLDIPANRGDVLCHRGVAREIAAATGRELLPIQTQYPAADLSPLREDLVTIEDPEMCRRYVAQVLEDIAPGSSPVWVEDRLSSLGLRPISNVVDATNLVMLELGQPMHAFDMDKLAGGRIIVRLAREGETLVTLDEVERKLTPEDLVIADAEKPVAIAGVMGGLDSMIGADTSRVLLESAWFEPRRIRTTASRLGMRTDASIRFERGADPEMALPAVQRFCNLMEGLGGARYQPSPCDVYPAPLVGEATLDWDRADALMGMKLDRNRLRGVLEALGFSIQAEEGSRITVSVPSWRQDVSRSVDLIEEAARHHGFDDIPSTLPGWSRAPHSPGAGARKKRESFRNLCAAAGFLETIHFSFISDSDDAAFRHREGETSSAPELSNPLVQHQKVMRSSLLPGLLHSAAYNVARGQEGFGLYEIGKRFWSDTEGRPSEAWTAAWLLYGKVSEGADWEGAARPSDFFDLKGRLEAVLSAEGAGGLEFRPKEYAFLEPGESAEVRWEGSSLGPAGRLGAKHARNLDLDGPVYVAEFDIDGWMVREDVGFQVEPASRYPWAERDLSLFLPADVSWGRVAEEIRKLGQDKLVRFWPVDRYSGKGVPEGKISLTLRLRYQSDERTLKAEEATGLAEAVVECLASALGAEQRT